MVADPNRYARAAMLPEGERTTAGPGTAARSRRDAAVTAFLDLRAASEDGDPAPLRAFLQAAVELVRPQLGAFRETWERGPERACTSTGAQLAAMAAGDMTHLHAASVHHLAAPGEERRMGCCGTLGTYIP